MMGRQEAVWGWICVALGDVPVPCPRKRDLGSASVKRAEMEAEL